MSCSGNRHESLLCRAKVGAKVGSEIVPVHGPVAATPFGPEPILTDLLDWMAGDRPTSMEGWEHRRAPSPGFPAPRLHLHSAMVMSFLYAPRSMKAAELSLASPRGVALGPPGDSVAVSGSGKQQHTSRVDWPVLTQLRLLVDFESGPHAASRHPSPAPLTTTRLPLPFQGSTSHFAFASLCAFRAWMATNGVASIERLCAQLGWRKFIVAAYVGLRLRRHQYRLAVALQVSE